MTQHTEYFVVDVRREWTNPGHHPFVTFWGPKNCGYVYYLDMAGRYTREDLDPGYHYKNVFGSLRALERYPVPCTFVESIAGPVPEHLRQMWRDVVGPVVINSGALRTLLRKHRLVIGDPAAFDKFKVVA